MKDDDIGVSKPNITSFQRRIVDAAADIIEAQVDSPEFMHSVLCQVGLPRRLTKERVFERSTGTASIRVEAGQLWTPRGWKSQPLPYGAKPRLVLLYACSTAIKTRSREIEIGRSAREFLDRLGLDNGGHEYARFRPQIEALAACRIQLGMSALVGTEWHCVTIDTKPIRRFEAWVQQDGASLGMWPGLIELSQEFYDTLIEHAVPLDPRAIHALQKSALALDLYAWLAQRLRRIRKADGIKLSWGNLREQFGQEYRVAKDFKKEFRAALVKVARVYPDARIEEEPGGLRLYPSPAPVPETKVFLSLPSAQSG